MKRSDGPEKAGGLSRRGFLGKVALGLVGAVGLSLPIKNLVDRGGEGGNPSDGLPEDSIYRPRDGDNRPGANA